MHTAGTEPKRLE